ncbi:uncharacterized protein LOC127843872 isoform X2 [Dreissena polymorpha]|nr:uncharacterized protein LOC127843872 isoform X2 [Dreissena polymorpha]
MLRLSPFLAQKWHLQILRSCRKWSSKVPGPSPDLPDYKTSVDVHEHKLSRPVAKSSQQKATKRWDGLHGLKERTKDSLIPVTLKEMEESEGFQITAKELQEMGHAKLTRDDRKKRQRALDNIGVPDFLEYWRIKVAEKQLKSPTDTFCKTEITTLQVNVGLYCNQACNHCHVESSPKRQEMMSQKVAKQCIRLLANSPHVTLLDLTGGAPELCSEFRYLATEGRALARDVIVRTNLTSLLEPGQEDMAQFFASLGLNVVASLPCYSAKNVNLQRGKGVFDKSIQALLTLNELGYGKPESGLKLDLVYNPLGAFLPPKQSDLEAKYREELWDVFGIVFNELFTVTNMPIKRFADFLYRRGELEDYMNLLVRNYNVDTMEKVMCRSMLSIDWSGRLYDCDFNQQLVMPVTSAGKERTVFDIRSCDDLHGNNITVDNHCYGCTAGMGSS